MRDQPWHEGAKEELDLALVVAAQVGAEHHGLQPAHGRREVGQREANLVGVQVVRAEHALADDEVERRVDVEAVVAQLTHEGVEAVAGEGAEAGLAGGRRDGRRRQRRRCAG